MPEVPLLLIVIIVIALVFDYTNGANDSSNAIAPLVSTRVLTPVQAVFMAAGLNLLGAFIGTEVASTVGKGIVNAEMMAGCRTLILAALLGAIVWNLITRQVGLPSSSSHALIGGLIGASVMYKGWDSVNFATVLSKVIYPLFLSPVGGFLGGYLIMHLIAWLTYRYRPRLLNKVFRKLTVISGAFMALSHGSNDAQKTMGIITLALFLFHQIPAIEVPFWVKLCCALAMMSGTAFGGWKIIKTVGNKIFKMEPVHGFAAQTSTTIIIAAASSIGAPISTTQLISTSILGVGSSKKFSAVKWGVAGNMVLNWLITIPASALVGAVCFYLINLF